MNELRIEVPGIPPSVNEYKEYRIVSPRGGKPVALWYLTAAAKAWFRDVGVFARGQQVRAEEYSISYVVFLKDARIHDVDNFAKCILDSLADQHGCGVIDDDKRVAEIHGFRRIDPLRPRTVIVVRVAQGSLL
jgi:Holliday junction resolvase RusA-like endonuclease